MLCKHLIFSGLATIIIPVRSESVSCTRIDDDIVCDGVTYALRHRSVGERRGLQDQECTIHNETSGAEITGLECRCDMREETLSIGDAEFFLNVFVCLILVLSAGLFSGLTIGLMSLDVEDLKLIEKAPQNSNRPHDREYAAKIRPIVETNHFLLVTLLLSNAAAMEALPIFLDEICPNRYIAILLSVTLVLFFGEVIPQALCKAYGLAIGANTAWFVKTLMKILFPIAWPIAKVLDWLFGEEAKSLRRIDWVIKFDMMLEEFEKNPHAREEYIKTAGEQPLSKDELGFMKGVLGLFQKKVSEKGRDGTTVMVPWKKAYTIELDDVLDSAKMNEILRMGYSRIPVLAEATINSQRDVIGILLVKNMITLNPQDCNTVRKLLSEEEAIIRTSSKEAGTHWDTRHTSKIWRNVLRIHKDISIFALIDLFQAKKTQIAVVYDYDCTATTCPADMLNTSNEQLITAALTNAYKKGHVLNESARKFSPCGITTLEDIIEELFGEQFVDETDPEFCQWHSEEVTRQQRETLRTRAWPTMDQLTTLVQQRLESNVGHSLQRSSSFGGSRMPQDMVRALAAGSNAAGEFRNSVLAGDKGVGDLDASLL